MVTVAEKASHTHLVITLGCRLRMATAMNAVGCLALRQYLTPRSTITRIANFTPTALGMAGLRMRIVLIGKRMEVPDLTRLSQEFQAPSLILISHPLSCKK